MIEELAPRELEVLSLISKGYSNHLIANELILERTSVENYINKIYRKLQIESNKDNHQRVLATLIYLRYKSDITKSILTLQSDITRAYSNFVST